MEEVRLEIKARASGKGGIERFNIAEKIKQKVFAQAMMKSDIPPLPDARAFAQ